MTIVTTVVCISEPTSDHIILCFRNYSCSKEEWVSGIKSNKETDQRLCTSSYSNDYI